MTEKELKSWIFAWTKDVNGTPLDSEINDLIYMVDAHLAPKMKRVDLDDMKEPEPAWSGYEQDARSQPKYKRVDLDEIKIKNADWISHRQYNAAIDDIKSKYGDLWAEVK